LQSGRIFGDRPMIKRIERLMSDKMAAAAVSMRL